MAIDKTKLVVEIDVDSNLKGEAKKVESAFKSMEMSVIAFNQGLELVQRTMQGLGRVFDATIGKAVKLEARVAEITTLLNESGDATKFFTNEILNLQRRFGTDQADLARSYYQAISSGAVGASNATELLATSQKLAIGGVTSLSQSVDGLTTIINAYGLGAERALNVSDSLFIGMREGKTTIGELSASLGEAVSLASATGVSFQELIASVSAVTTGGVLTAQAVTQVRSAMVGLSKQTPQLTEVLSELGITNIKTAVETRGLVNVLKLIIGQTDGTTEALTELFGRIEAVNAILALTSDSIGGKFVEIMEEMGKAATNAGAETETAFQKMANTTEFRFKQLAGQTEARFTAIGMILKSAFIPAMETVVALFESLEKSVVRVSKALQAVDFKALADQGESLAHTLMVVGSAAGLAFTPQLAATITAAAVAMKGFAVAAWSAAAPIALVAAKLLLVSGGILTTIAVVEAFLNNMNKLGTVMEMFGNVIVLAFQKVGLVINGIFLGILVGIEKVFEGMNKVGVMSDAVLARFRQNLVRAADINQELIDGIGKTEDAIADASRQIDIGFSGQVIKQGLAVLKEFNAEMDQTAIKAAEAAESAKKISATGAIEIKLPKFELKSEDKKALEEFVNRTKSMEAFIAESAMTQAEIIESRKQAQLGEVRALEQKLRAQKALSAEGRRQLVQIEAFKDAVEGVADVMQAQARQQEARRIAGGAGDALAGVGQVVGDMGAALGSAFGGSIQKVMTSVMGSVSKAFMKIAGSTVSMIVGVILLIPKAVNAVAGIVDELARFPENLEKALFKLDDAVLRFAKNFFGQLVNMIEKALVEGINHVAKTLPDAVVEGVAKFAEALNKLIERLPEIAEAFMKSIFKADLGPKLVISIIKALPKLISTIVKMIPHIVNAIIQGLVDGVKEFFNELWDMIFGGAGEGMEKGLSSAMKKLQTTFGKASEIFAVSTEELGEGLLPGQDMMESAKKSMKAFEDLWKKLWNWIVKSWRKLWNWVVKLWRDIWNGAVELWRDLWNGIVEILQSVWDGIIEAWRGVWEFASNVWESLKDFIEGVFEAGGQLWENLWSNIKDALGILGSVLEDIGNMVSTFIQKLSEWAKGFFAELLKVWEKVAGILRDAFDFIKREVFDKFVQALNSIFNWINNHVLKPFAAAIHSIFNWIKVNVFDPVIAGFKSAFNWIKVNVFDRINENLMHLFTWIKNNVMDISANNFVEKFNQIKEKVFDYAGRMFEEAGKKLLEVFDWIKTNIFNWFVVKLSGVFEKLKTEVLEPLMGAGSAIANGFRTAINAVGGFFEELGQRIWKGVTSKVSFSYFKSLGSQIWEGFKNAVTDISKDLFGGGGGVLGGGGGGPSAVDVLLPGASQAKRILGLSTGGMVQALSNGGQVFQSTGTDTVPAMLTPGEFVMSKPAVQRIGISNLNAMNRGATAGGTTNQSFNFNITIENTGTVDEDFFNNTMMPMVRDELRRDSLNGRRVLERTGLG